MAEALRHGLMLHLRMMFGAAPMLLALVLPLAGALLLLLPTMFDRAGFAALWLHPQLWGGLLLTLGTGLVATGLSLVLAILIVASQRDSLDKRAGWMLAMPHLALAFGLAFLLAPTGLLARLVATLLTGWTSPPAWQTVQDPLGLGLTLALVLKETPFLVWAMAQVLAQDELRQRFGREVAQARSLGHAEQKAFLQVVVPQLLQRCIWPIVAVLAYGLTVVDMALVIGPGQPPTLAQLVWNDLNDGDAAMNARGAAGTMVLTVLLGGLLAVFALGAKALRPLWRRWLTRPATTHATAPRLATWLWPLWQGVFTLVIVALVVQSVSLHWPFPRLAAAELSLKAWALFFYDYAPLAHSLGLGLVCSVVALLACLSWFETQPPARDRLVLGAATLVLCLPALLLALGQYRVLLLMGWTGTWAGLLFAHILPVAAYMLIMLQGPYRAYDGRWQSVGLGLGAARLHFLLRVKWPMLKAPLLSALAVGFAVSVAQFVPAQLAAAGRFSTLPMEAVTLSAGGNRSLMAVAALMLMALPLLAFYLAARFSRPRWVTP